MSDGTASDPMIDTTTGTTYRTIPEHAALLLECVVDTTAWDLSATGVPYVDAILTVRFRDDVDESECPDVLFCHDRVNIAWNPVASLGGAADHTWKTLTLPLAASPYQLIRLAGGFQSCCNSIVIHINNMPQPGGPVPLAIDHISLEFLPRSQFLARREEVRAAKGFIRADYLNGTLPAPPARQ